MSNSIYSEDNSEKQEKEFTLSVLTEDKAGLLNHITIIFNRRKLNISSLNVSSTEVAGVSRFTIVITTTRETIDKVVKQIQKLIDVLGAFVYEKHQIFYQELALYKLPIAIFMGGIKVETLVRSHGARIVVIEDDHIIIEKTGHKEETHALYKELEPYGILEFIRSGRVAISQSKRKTETFLKQLEELKSNQLTIKS
uniref:acetolactate synthase small subunit n=1 Tax=Fulvivirga sp. TaxID=1931237 RepID=UPI00404B2179